MLGKNAEDVSERGQGGGQLVLQHVSVFLLQYTTRQLDLNELHHGLHVWFGSCHSQDDGVSITKPIREETDTHRHISVRGSDDGINVEPHQSTCNSHCLCL